MPAHRVLLVEFSVARRVRGGDGAAHQTATRGPASSPWDNLARGQAGAGRYAMAQENHWLPRVQLQVEKWDDKQTYETLAVALAETRGRFMIRRGRQAAPGR